MVPEGSQNGIRALWFVFVAKYLRLLPMIYDNVQKITYSRKVIIIKVSLPTGPAHRPQ
jgi:hypothetical protein